MHMESKSLSCGGPMTTFDEREHAFENKFAHDEELRFRAEARRNKLIGLWAAEIIGKTGAEAQAYAKDVIAADFKEAGEEDVYRKLSEDLGALSDEVTIRAKMAEYMVEAKRQIMKEA